MPPFSPAPGTLVKAAQESGCLRASRLSCYRARMRYAAFIRGINVGGRVLIKMADLKTLCESAGLAKVGTILASGNIVFDSSKSPAGVERQLQAALEKKYGRPIAVFVRTIGELREIEKLQPFKEVEVTKNTRLYVSFCRAVPEAVASRIHPGFAVLGTSGREIFSVLEVSDTVKTPDVMKLLDEKVGETTVRNWNTVQKVIKAAT
jgi:uncharacterized protein (DUF1697 family)